MGKQKVSITFDRNEIHTWGRFLAGFLLIAFIVTPLILIIGLWPDRMPDPNTRQLYAGRLFHFHDLGLVADKPNTGYTIHLNTIMFLLVALAGFLGNMLHLSTSFTNYVGSGKFKRSWILWYVVKPFTASGIAVIFYMVLKAGLLNFNDGGGANPYAIVILAMLAGLFTDKATLKLEEIFTVLFRPKDERPDRIDETTIKIKGFNPKKLVIDGDNAITVSGEGLDKHNLKVRINELDIPDFDVQSDSLSFKFKIPDELKTESKLTLSILNETGEPVYTGDFELDGQAPDVPPITPRVTGKKIDGEKIDGEKKDGEVVAGGIEQEEEEPEDAGQFVKG